MTVYHGTIFVIENPDISYSKNYLDFGKGFYLTANKVQAEKWAKRKAMRNRKSPIVNVYELKDELSAYKVLRFENENEKWLDFVCACRKGETRYKQYDIIIGNVADDDVFKTVDMYFKGIWDKEKTISELKYYKPNDQICIVNQNVISECLKFKDSYEVNIL